MTWKHVRLCNGTGCLTHFMFHKVYIGGTPHWFIFRLHVREIFLAVSFKQDSVCGVIFFQRSLLQSDQTYWFSLIRHCRPTSNDNNLFMIQMYLWRNVLLNVPYKEHCHKKTEPKLGHHLHKQIHVSDILCATFLQWFWTTFHRPNFQNGRDLVRYHYNCCCNF